MTPTHFFGGYLALQASRKFWALPELSQAQTTGLLIFGLLFSVAVDLDVVFSGGIAGHHKQLTHYPLFWLVVSATLYLIGLTLKSQFTQATAVVLLVSSWTHLALDLVGVTMGIHLLWPFSMKEFSITPLKTDFISNQARWDYIMKSPVMWVGDSLIIILGSIKMGLDVFKTWFR